MCGLFPFSNPHECLYLDWCYATQHLCGYNSSNQDSPPIASEVIMELLKPPLFLHVEPCVLTRSLHQGWSHSSWCLTSLHTSGTQPHASQRSLFSLPVRWTPWSRRGFLSDRPGIENICFALANFILSLSSQAWHPINPWVGPTGWRYVYATYTLKISKYYVVESK